MSQFENSDRAARQMNNFSRNRHMQLPLGRNCSSDLRAENHTVWSETVGFVACSILSAFVVNQKCQRTVLQAHTLQSLRAHDRTRITIPARWMRRRCNAAQMLK